MSYLSAKKVIHRDLAARNILVDTKGNNSFSGMRYVLTDKLSLFVMLLFIFPIRTCLYIFTFILSLLILLAVDQWQCKVADFGFARDVMANNVYERKTDGKLPIR